MAERFASRPALRPLAHRDFRLLLAGSAVVGVLFPLHFLALLGPVPLGFDIVYLSRLALAGWLLYLFLRTHRLAIFPAFALFGTENLLLFGVAMVVVFGVIHALFYGAQGTLYASLYPTEIRYTGLSVVYQFSGIYASGVTPLILTALIGASGGSPWLACGYLVATSVISVVATAAIRKSDLHL